MINLERLWQEQVAYNNRIRIRSEYPSDQSYWAKQYILGLISELDEILEEIDWKMHRSKNSVLTDKHNLGRELADATKYIWCLWEVFSFTSEEMLQFIAEKNVELEYRFEQEFDHHIAPNINVLITDIDGTLGDWRRAFIEFIRKEEKDIIIPTDPGRTLAIEADLNIPYLKYVRLKKKFESTGGYQYLKPYPEAIKFLHRAVELGWDVQCYTARPHSRYGRIWSDTKIWLDNNGFRSIISELNIGEEERILKGCELQEQGHRVLLLEDSPSLALRAAASNLQVLLVDQPYNRGISHKNIKRVSFESIVEEEQNE